LFVNYKLSSLYHLLKQAINNNPDYVVVIDVATLTPTSTTIQVENGPTAVAVTPNNQYVFVLNASDNSVSVINMQSLTVSRTVSLGSVTPGFLPQGMIVTPNSRYILVNQFLNNVSVIDTQSWGVMNINVGGQPGGIGGLAVTPDNQYAFVVNYQNNYVSQIDINNLSATPVNIMNGYSCTAIAVTPDNQYVLVSNLNTTNYYSKII